ALAALAAPTVGIVTTVAAVHTEFLGSLDGVREEKAGLIRALPADGAAVLNADDPRVAGMARDTRARGDVRPRGHRARARRRRAGGRRARPELHARERRRPAGRHARVRRAPQRDQCPGL